MPYNNNNKANKKQYDKEHGPTIPGPTKKRRVGLNKKGLLGGEAKRQKKLREALGW